MRALTTLVVEFALLLASSTLICAQSPLTQSVQDAPATDCDAYAAPPDRKTSGIPFEKVNPDLAIPACESAIQKYPNSSRLIFQLGRAYHKKNDFSSALVQYRKAAELGFADAQNNLGSMYVQGQGVPQDYAEAIKWYRKSAEQGNASAQYNLGSMYDNGQGVPRNYAEAAKWYRKAADQGEAHAQDNLGTMYSNGEGVPQDNAEAIKWIRKSAEQGNASAQYNLGSMYVQGQGVPQDDKEAVKWFRMAAEQGNEAAKKKLAKMEEGKQSTSSAAPGRGREQVYAVFLCLHYAAAPQLDSCQPLRVNGEAMYYQSGAQCKKTAEVLNARGPMHGWACMAKPAPPTWQPVR